MSASEDVLVRNYDHHIELPVFEGPLDLLLFLIRKNEIDIYDIPIETVLRQYLDVLRNIKELQLEVAGEFFVMAATLMYIKSRLLLPKDQQIAAEDESEEGIDPRWELVEQLLEYRKFKEAAEKLGDLSEIAQHSLPRAFILSTEELPTRPLRPTDRITLWNTFNQVLRRLAEKIVVGEIHDEIVTVADRMELIIHRLKTSPSFRFSELFLNGAPKTLYHLISTFLAILELTRLKHINIEQDENFQDILCTKREDGEAMFHGHTGLESEFDQPSNEAST